MRIRCQGAAWSCHSCQKKPRLPNTVSPGLVSDQRPRFAVHGSAGSYVKYGLDPQEAQLKAGLTPKDPGFGITGLAGVLTRPDGSREDVPTERSNYTVFYSLVADSISIARISFI